MGNFALIGVANMQDLKTFDETNVFMTQVLPLLDKAHALCVEHKLPYLSIVQYSAGDDPDDNTKTRAGLSVMCAMEGDRTAPTLLAMAGYLQNPAKAIPDLLLAAAGHDRTVDQDPVGQHAAGHA